MGPQAKSEIAINEFADWTDNEKKKMLFDYKPTQYDLYSEYDVEDLPASVDWRTKCSFTVKNVGPGSFDTSLDLTAVAQVECQTALSTGQLLSLSMWNLYDCSGGIHSEDERFSYIKKNPLMKESDYPFHMNSCGYNPAKGVGKI